jgi:hypothetical protein
MFEYEEESHYSLTNLPVPASIPSLFHGFIAFLEAKVAMTNPVTFRDITTVFNRYAIWHLMAVSNVEASISDCPLTNAEQPLSDS